MRRGSTPFSLRPSPLPPLVGTAPLNQASFPRHLIAGKSPNFLFFPSLYPPLWHSTYLLLRFFYKDSGVLSGLVLLLSCPRGTGLGTVAAL